MGFKSKHEDSSATRVFDLDLRGLASKRTPCTVPFNLVPDTIVKSCQTNVTGSRGIEYLIPLHRREIKREDPI